MDLRITAAKTGEESERRLVLARTFVGEPPAMQTGCNGGTESALRMWEKLTNEGRRSGNPAGLQIKLPESSELISGSALASRFWRRPLASSEAVDQRSRGGPATAEQRSAAVSLV